MNITSHPLGISLFPTNKLLQLKVNMVLFFPHTDIQCIGRITETMALIDHKVGSVNLLRINVVFYD
jgi:hypothetical protein